MSVYTLVFGGVTPIGSLWAGWVSEASSPAACMVIAGAIGLVSCAIAVLFARPKKAR
jgi:predicted MFS family arabinose efflux permease